MYTSGSAIVGDGNVAADEKAAHWEFERLDGELDAAFVFAAAAKDASQIGKAELSDACFSDATDCYANVVFALSKSDLTGEQRQLLHAKLIRLRQLCTHALS
jgi:hypothetical protein